MPDRKRKAAWYAIATLPTAILVVITHLVHADRMDPDASLVVLMLPVLLASYVGGFGPGLAATVMATGLSLAIASPEYVDDPVDLVRWLALVTGGLMISVLGGSLRRASQRAARNGDRATEFERRFSESFHASPIPIALSNAKTRRFTDVNDAFARLSGWDREEMLGRTPVELGLFDSKEHDRLARQLRRSKLIRNRALVVQRKDGQLRDVRLALDLITIDDQPFSMITVIDETEHKRTRAELEKSSERLTELAAVVGEAFWLMAIDFKETLYVSPAYETIFGRTCASLYANPQSWYDAVHPDDRERLVHTQGEYSPEADILEHRIVRPDGEIRWIRSELFTVRDAEGFAVRVAGVTADITKQRALEEQLRQTQKMESLGMLAGGVAHDFNNVLAVIASCNEMLGEAIAHDHTDRELVDEIDGAVQRASGLTRQLLAFSRKQVTAPVVLDLNASVKDIKKMLRRLVGEGIVLTASLDPELRAIRADPSNVVQVLMNLAVNARDAMPRGGSLVIETRNAGDEIMLAVSDTGIGMSPEVKARVFEPFFTTKDIGKGTGMGLAVVHGIVDQAGGRLDIESTIGVGTTFRVFLPAIDAQPTSIGVEDSNDRGIERIIMVDDDDYVRRAASRALRSRGYTVLEARDGQAALQMLRDREANIDLLLTDVVMPGMDGRQLAETASAMLPELRVLYTSGHTDDAVLRYGVKHAEVAFIEKPFRVRSLAGMVRQVLDA